MDTQLPLNSSLFCFQTKFHYQQYEAQITYSKKKGFRASLTSPEGLFRNVRVEALFASFKNLTRVNLEELNRHITSQQYHMRVVKNESGRLLVKFDATPIFGGGCGGSKLEDKNASAEKKEEKPERKSTFHMDVEEEKEEGPFFLFTPESRMPFTLGSKVEKEASAADLTKSLSECASGSQKHAALLQKVTLMVKGYKETPKKTKELLRETLLPAQSGSPEVIHILIEFLLSELPDFHAYELLDELLIGLYQILGFADPNKVQHVDHQAIVVVLCQKCQFFEAKQKTNAKLYLRLQMLAGILDFVFLQQKEKIEHDPKALGDLLEGLKQHQEWRIASKAIHAKAALEAIGRDFERREELSTWYDEFRITQGFIERNQFELCKTKFNNQVDDIPKENYFDFFRCILLRLIEKAHTRSDTSEARVEAIQLFITLFTDSNNWKFLSTLDNHRLNKVIAMKVRVLDLLGSAATENEEAEIRQAAKEGLNVVRKNASSLSSEEQGWITRRLPENLDELKIKPRASLSPHVGSSSNVLFNLAKQTLKTRDEIIQEMKTKSLNDPEKDALAEDYNPLYCSLGGPLEAPASLDEKLSAFLESEQRLFVLQGEPKSGKTRFMRKFFLDTWAGFVKKERIPLFLTLTRTTNYQKVLDEAFKKEGLLDTQIEQFKREQSVLLFVDDLHLLEKKAPLLKELFSQLRDLKVVVTCDTSFLVGEDRTALFSSFQGSSQPAVSFTEVTLIPHTEIECRSHLHVGDAVSMVTVSADKKWLASISGTKLYIWDIATGKVIRKLETHKNKGMTPPACAFSKNGQFFAFSAVRGQFNLVDLQNQKNLTVGQGHRSPIQSWYFSDDSQSVASLSADFFLHEKMDGTLLSTSVGLDSAKVTATAIGPDAKLVALGTGEGEIHLNAGRDGVLRDRKGAVTICAFSPKGNWLVSSVADQKVNLWSLKTKKIERTFSSHTGVITACCFSSNEKLIVTVGLNAIEEEKSAAAVSYQTSTLYLWNPANGFIYYTIPDLKGKILSCCFTDDHEYVITSGEDGTIRFWKVAEKGGGFTLKP